MVGKKQRNQKQYNYKGDFFMNKKLNKLGKTIMASTLVLSMFSVSIAPTFASEITTVTKEETVYGILNADGSTNHLIVSNHIQKGNDIKTIQVPTELEDIKLLMEDVEFSNDSDELTFTTDGSDIYYQGTSTEALPITTEITYYLDDQVMSSDEIAGKTGHFKMEIHQTNSEKVTVTINGEEKEVCMPFETALVLTMDNKIFENVTVNLGEIVDDGSNKVLTTVLTPGLKESFEAIDSDKITDTIIVEADVTDFELSPMYMTTICKLPEINISEYLDKLDEVEDNLEEFTEASQDLTDGAASLNEGVKTYFGQQATAFTSFNEYLAGDKQLISSIVAFSGSLSEFNTALGSYVAGVNNLAAGVLALSQSSPTLATYMSTLNAGLAQVLPQNEMTADLFTLAAQLEAGMLQLDEGIQAANAGGQALAAGSTQVTVGSQQLTDGAAQLAAGGTQLIEANGQLSTGMTLLTEGADQVTAGSNDLYEGVEKFQTEGVDPLAVKLEDSLSKISEFNVVYDQLLEKANDYNNFSGTSEDFDSSVVFILKTAGIN
jgi:putative membrane protein